MHALLEYLFDLERRGVKLGLEHTQELLRRCGNPHQTLSIAQIAGTNGKGSTAAIATYILKQHGRKVGLFTSPHLCRYNERIRVDGLPIGDSYIIRWVEKHKDDLDEIPSTFFEANTAMALSYFRDRRVDVAILETGLGGRLDATTATNPSWTALTPIDLDHMDMLGDTIHAIAREKAGILQSGVPCFSAPQSQQVSEVVQNEAERVGAPIIFVPQATDTPAPRKLPGRHQQINASVALALTNAILGKDFDSEIANTAVELAFWPGRYQQVSDHPKVIYDVAHNPHGMAAVLTTIAEEKLTGQKRLVLAMQQGKEIARVLNMLLPEFDAVVLTQTDTRNFIPAAELAELSGAAHPHIQQEPIASKAIQETLKKARKNDFVAILGSHYLGPAVAKVFKISFDNLK
ncbi:MAG: bifunctional folylpolyglutamate synthase/dihydrofolate synthase [Fidelibacterota bacterium]|nr:MAG: bifunctional folylpolyglutamate synthase/dihydrofolate synthase [Candidatus Neomarinimicrobiota bacterium]